MLSRREFLLSSLFLLTDGALLSPASSETIRDKDIKSLSLRVIYITEILRPPKAKVIRIWFPVPETDHAQEVTGLEFQARIPYKRTEDKEMGNTFFYLETGNIKEGERFTLLFNIRRKVELPEEDRGNPDIFLKPSEWEKWDSSIMDFAQRITGREKDPLKIARIVFDALIERLEYIHEVCGRGVSTIAFEERKGRCDEFHALFRSILMYKGIPVRWEEGILLPYPSKMKRKGEIEADCINAHSWVRFYAGSKWIPVDVSEAKRRPDMRDFYFGKIPPDRIRFSTGRGIDLVPKQEDIINTFAYTYIEADGIPAVYGYNYRNRLRFEVVKMET